MNHKSGFVNIIGSPNAGKSTLLNAFLGEKLAITTHKAQTTRHRIHGIINEPDYQIVLSDTPGIIDPAYKMQEGMMQFVYTALSDADVLLVIIDVHEKKFKNEKILKKIQESVTPTIVLLNKLDTINQEILEEKMTYWKGVFDKAEIYGISALLKFNIKEILDRIVAIMPEAPPYFPKDTLTDRSERFFVEEMIREQILIHYQKEIPYSCQVEVESFKDQPNIVKIEAVIYVSRESQKGIIIGHKGRDLKKVGTGARLELEKFFDKKVFLSLFVKVNKEWRNDERQLRRFGYLN